MRHGPIGLLLVAAGLAFGPAATTAGAKDVVVPACR
jgi:hypothetical protein